MARAIFLAAFLMLLTSFAGAQQDPDDPGLQDSIIIENMQFVEPPRSFIVNVLAVTDDPIDYIIIPLSYIAPNGGFEPNDVFFYNNIMGWEYKWDSIMVDRHEVFIRAWSDTAYMNTAGQRLLVAGVHFQNNMAPPQNMIVDTTWDSGLASSIALRTYDDTSTITPAFLGGIVEYLPQSVDDADSINEPDLPLSYPNPFGSSGIGIRFTISSDQVVRVSVFNILGQKVWGGKGFFRRGNNEIRWKAIDYGGNLVPGGVYFSKVETEEGVISGKLTLLR